MLHTSRKQLSLSGNRISSTTTASRERKSRSMAQHQLNGLRVAILATNGFEEAELFEPREALEKAGAQTASSLPRRKIQG